VSAACSFPEEKRECCMLRFLRWHHACVHIVQERGMGQSPDYCSWTEGGAAYQAGLAAARTEVLALSEVVMPALAMLAVCCSITSWMAVRSDFVHFVKLVDGAHRPCPPAPAQQGSKEANTSAPSFPCSIMIDVMLNCILRPERVLFPSLHALPLPFCSLVPPLPHGRFLKAWLGQRTWHPPGPPPRARAPEVDGSRTDGRREPHAAAPRPVVYTPRGATLTMCFSICDLPTPGLAHEADVDVAPHLRHPTQDPQPPTTQDPR